MKDLMKGLLRKAGFELKRIQPPGPESIPGSDKRPIGDVLSFLKDVQARGFTPRGILDVGAGHGRWTRRTRAIYPDVPALLIEPLDEMVEWLDQLTKEEPNIEYIHAGAASQSGELVQTIWEQIGGSSFIPAENAEQLSSGEQRRTHMVNIDSLLAERPDFHPDLVKLDVQGFELEALRGAESLFGRTELFIMETNLFEFMPGMPLTCDCMAFMAERGYPLYEVTEYLRRPLDGAMGQVDLAFAKADGILRSTNDWK